MSARSYARGNAVIRREIDTMLASSRSHNELVRKWDWQRATPFNTLGCIRFDGQTWHFCNQQAKGWSSQSFWYKSLNDLLDRWNIRLADYKMDTAGGYWDYEILKEWGE